MPEHDRHGSDLDLTDNRTLYPGKYIPYEEVDRTKYELIHPENAMIRLGMSARTAYRKIDSSELEYTLEKGSKRIIVKKDLSLTDPRLNIVGQMTEENKNVSDNISDVAVRLQTKDRLIDYQQILIEKEQEIRTLRDELNKVRGMYQHSIDELKAQLEKERVANARIEGELKNIERVIDGKEQTVSSQIETISSQKTTIEALNNERLVITHQLQKYRSPDETKETTKNPTWMFWKK